jgi:arylformamidase
VADANRERIMAGEALRNHANTLTWDISPPVHAGCARSFRATRRYAQQWSAPRSARLPGQRERAHAVAAHVGAHADAPLHYDPMRALPIGRGRWRPTWALPRDPRHRLRAADRVGAPGARLTSLPPRVLVRTYARACRSTAGTRSSPPSRPRPSSAWPTPGVQLIGIDTASIDPADSKTLDSHQVIRRRGLRVLENLVLDDVPEGDYELIALPLKLTTADASPCARCCAHFMRQIAPPALEQAQAAP